MEMHLHSSTTIKVSTLTRVPIDQQQNYPTFPANEAEFLRLYCDKMYLMNLTRGQSNLTKSASQGPIPRLGVTPGGWNL